MESDSNMARDIRAMTERLSNYADEYDATGQLEERDQINEAAEAVGALHSLAGPDDDE